MIHEPKLCSESFVRKRPSKLTKDTFPRKFRIFVFLFYMILSEQLYILKGYGRNMKHTRFSQSKQVPPARSPVVLVYSSGQTGQPAGSITSR